MFTHFISGYRHFGDCLFLSNGMFEVAIPLHFGIRIIRFGRVGGENLFYEQPSDMTDLTTEDGWRIYGGHRLWLAPESVLTYCPDNKDISYTLIEKGAVLFQPLDSRLHVIKSITVEFNDNGIAVTHTVQNKSSSPLKAALWGISAMRAGGIQKIPFSPPATGATPNRLFSLWDYTDLGDIRASYFKDCIILRHLPLPQLYKIGVNLPEGCIFYTLGNDIFVLTYDIIPGTVYPDNGVSYETYMCPHMTELETLSPLYEIAPGCSVNHRENWSILCK
jgi:hypothetical protein